MKSQTYIFEIIQTKSIPIDLPIDKIRKYPMHEIWFDAADKKTVIVKIKPQSTTNINEFLEYLCTYFKYRYSAYSVTYGKLQTQLQ